MAQAVIQNCCSLISGIPIQGLQIRAAPLYARLNKTVTYDVTWSQGTDVNFTVYFGDGTSYFWNWQERNHTTHYLANRVVLTHAYLRARNYTVLLVASNEAGDVMRNLTQSVEPPLRECLHVTTEYKPTYSPNNVTFIISAVTYDREANIFTWCDLEVKGMTLDRVILVIRPTHPGYYTYPFSFTDSEVTARLICKNHVSSKIFSTTIIMQQDISGLVLTSQRPCWRSDENASLVVDMATGSHVEFNFTVKEGGPVYMYRHPNIPSHKFPYTIRHRYSLRGIFNPSVYVYNKYFSSRTMINESLCVQDPIQVLNVTGQTMVKTPPGNFEFLITAVGHYPAPTYVTCRILGHTALVNAYNLSQGEGHTLNFVFSRKDVGPAITNITCWNKVSRFNLSHETMVYEAVDLLGVTAYPMILPSGDVTTIAITATNGSHVTYDVGFGDGQSEAHTLSVVFANTLVFNITHVYKIQGNYSVIVSGNNPVSNDTVVSNKLIIQHKLSTVLLAGDHDILWTPGLASYELRLGPGHVDLVDIHCQYNWGDNTSSYVYYEAFAGNDVKRITHTFPRNACGLVNTTVTCQNLVSNTSAHHQLNVTLDAVLLASLWMNQTVLLTNETHFVLKVKRFGSHSCFLFDFGDGAQNRTIYGVASGQCSSKATEFEISYTEILHGTTYIKHKHVYSQLGQYFPSVYSFNHITSDIVVARTVVLDWPCEFPNVTFFSNSSKANPHIYMRSVAIPIRPEFIIDCMKTQRYYTKWSAYSVSLDRETEVPLLNVPAIPNTDIPPQTFEYGLVRVQWNISMDNVIGMWTINSTFFKIVKSPLKVGMVGGSEQAIGWNRTIVINSIDRTYDPDRLPSNKSGMSFKYYCRRLSESFPNTSGVLEDVVPTLPSDITEEHIRNGTDFGGCFYAGPGKMPWSSGSFELDTGNMKIDTTYVIRVVAYKDTRVGHFDKILRVLEGDPPIMDAV